MKKQIGDYADINGIKLKRENEGICFCEHFSHEGALYLAKRRGLRLPTREEWELMLKPGHTWDEEKKGIWIGQTHYLKKETDLSTFLPADGWWHYAADEHCRQGIDGCYWSSDDEGEAAYQLYFHGDKVDPMLLAERKDGMSVRFVVSN
jgi:uncharacterized protein (TIGR02145 family)